MDVLGQDGFIAYASVELLFFWPIGDVWRISDGMRFYGRVPRYKGRVSSGAIASHQSHRESELGS